MTAAIRRQQPSDSSYTRQQLLEDNSEMTSCTITEGSRQQVAGIRLKAAAADKRHQNPASDSKYQPEESKKPPKNRRHQA